MANLVVVLILGVNIVWIVSPNYVLFHTDKIVTFAATKTSNSDSSLDCALSCELNYPCISYAYHPGRTKCYHYDRVIHHADSTDVYDGLQTYTSEFGDDNIALHKPTAQSSNYGSYVSSSGVDGDKSIEFHTARNAWWCVDLMAVHEMKWLIMYNSILSAIRLNRIKGFEIRLAASGGCTQTGFSTSTLCHKDKTNIALNIYTISNCSEPNIQFDARYVFIYQPTTNLHLNEVEIVPWGCRA